MSQLAVADGPLLEQILDGTHTIWHDGLTRAAYSRYWYAQLATAWGARHVTRWALVDGNVVLSGAKMYRFDAVLDGRAVQVAGIGAVFTAPDRRGRGYAAELLNRLLEREAADGCDVALLFSEIGADYYRRFGFESIPLDDVRLRVVEDDRRGAPAMMVRSGEDRDLADIEALDAARAEASRFHLTRDRDLIKFAMARRRLHAGLRTPGARELQFFVAEEGASAVAYVVISVKGSEWTIDSCGDRDPAGARIGAILQVLIAREPSQHRPSISAWLPASLRPPQLAIIGAAPSRDLMMMRPLTDRGRPDRGTLAPADVVFWRGDAF